MSKLQLDERIGRASLLPLSDDERHEILRTTFRQWRENGRIPNVATKALDITKLEMGDLILLKASSPGFIQRGIRRGQKLEFPASMGDHWMFSHAMVSRGGDETYEANADEQVHRNTFWDHMDGTNTFKVMRLPNKSIQNRAQIALNAAELTGRQYDTFGAFFASIEQVRRFFPYRDRDSNDNSFMCSSVFAAACFYEGIDLGLGIENKDAVTPRFISPAALSASPYLVEIDMPLLNLSDYE
mgnify:FL=1